MQGLSCRNEVSKLGPELGSNQFLLVRCPGSEHTHRALWQEESWWHGGGPREQCPANPLRRQTAGTQAVPERAEPGCSLPQSNRYHQDGGGVATSPANPTSASRLENARARGGALT